MAILMFNAIRAPQQRYRHIRCAAYTAEMKESDGREVDRRAMMDAGA